jgi:hypothetical protein
VCLLRGTDWIFKCNSVKSASSGSNKQHVKEQRWFEMGRMTEGVAVPCATTTAYGKCKAVSLQAWSGPEGSRKLRFPYFMTTAQDGGKVVSLTHPPPLPQGNTPGTHFC